MSDYKQRVRAEKTELSERLSKLELFLGSDDFADVDAEQQTLLIRQAYVMSLYQDILTERIEAFTVPF